MTATRTPRRVYNPRAFSTITGRPLVFIAAEAADKLGTWADMSMAGLVVRRGLLESA